MISEDEEIRMAASTGQTLDRIHGQQTSQQLECFTIWSNVMFFHVFTKVRVNVAARERENTRSVVRCWFDHLLVLLEFLWKTWVLGHLLHIFPFFIYIPKSNIPDERRDAVVPLTCWKTHHRKDAIQLIVMVGSAGLDIFLFTMEDRFVGQ